MSDGAVNKKTDIREIVYAVLGTYIGVSVVLCLWGILVVTADFPGGSVLSFVPIWAWCIMAPGAVIGSVLGAAAGASE